MTYKFSDLLAKPSSGLQPFGYKQAGIESPDEQQLEQDFARLAYMFVQDRAPGLIKYMLGFEVVQREEDGSRAVGLFGFKLGKDYYYVPAFFLNNQIKGVDLLFSKKTNMFVPLTEEWVNYVVNRQTIELGGAADASRVQKDFENPNFEFLASPPMGPVGKTAEADLALKAVAAKKADGEFVSFKQAYADMQDQLIALLEKDAEFQKAWAGVVSCWTDTALPFEKNAETGILHNWFENVGGPRAMSTFLNTLTRQPKFADAALTFYPDVKALYVHEFNPKLLQKAAAKITVTSNSSSLGNCCSEPSDSYAKKKLVRDGFTIHDKREPKHKSEVYEIDYDRRFSNPDKSGTYQVMLRDGRTTKCWVFMPSKVSKNQAVVVVEQDKNLCRLAEPGAVYVRDDAAGDTADAYKDAVSIEDMELDKKYVLIDDKGNSTTPVKIRSVISEGDKRTRLRVTWADTYNIAKRPSYGKDFEGLHRRDYHRSDIGPCCDAEYVELASHKGPITMSGTDTLVMPSNWKALELHDGTSKDTSSWEAERLERDAFQLGTLFDVMEGMTKNGFYKLSVASDDGLEYYFRVNDLPVTQPVRFKQACVTLVCKYGLAVEDADTLLDEARRLHKCQRTIKVAQMGSPLVGVNMPPPQEQGPTVDPETGVPMYEPDAQEIPGQFTGMPPPPDGNAEGINIGGEAEIDSQAQGLAQQAAQLGQKTVFDHAAIGGLAKLHDTNAIMDSYIPELMRALDRLGRILFLFYWKNEDFAERYGSDAMPEMEDLIRGVFKSFGEVALQLRKKAIDKDDADTVEV